MGILQIALHSILAFTHEEYGRATALSNIASQLSWPHRNGTGDFESLEKETLTSAWAPEATQTETETETGVDDAEDSATSDDSPSDTLPSADTPRKANATLLMLARNSELEKAAQSVRELEEKFNFRFNYPWIFLNEVEFSDEFKA